MKATVELPDDLVRELKIRAATEGRKLKDVMADTLRRGLGHESESGGVFRRRVHLPLVTCAHPASPDSELTPERVDDLLREEEIRAVGG